MNSCCTSASASASVSGPPELHAGVQEVFHSRDGGQGLDEHHVGAVVPQAGLPGAPLQAKLQGLTQR